MFDGSPIAKYNKLVELTLIMETVNVLGSLWLLLILEKGMGYVLCVRKYMDASVNCKHKIM